ncbi:hypothetical protein [Massilia sp. TN1-12]|uniref:hypothetical protein n=1 Tax=Massilia paldalensis TaxID=3377675 RepID=UPI00384A552D
MSFIALFFFVAGVFLLIFGFKKNNRALLTFAARFWLASGVCSDFAYGFLMEGQHWSIDASRHCSLGPLRVVAALKSTAESGDFRTAITQDAA